MRPGDGFGSKTAIELCHRHGGTCFDSGRPGSWAPIAGGAVGSPQQDPTNRTRRLAAVATGMGGIGILFTPSGVTPYCFVMPSPLLSVPLHIWSDHVLKTFGPALLLATGLAITAAPVCALQIVVTQVDKNTDGSMTYHFAVKTDQGETLTPGESKATSDFVTVYNFTAW